MNHSELIAAGTLIATDGNMAVDVTLATDTMGSVVLDISAVTGTTPTLDVWMEKYDQTPQKYFPVPYDQQLTEPATPGDDAAANTHRKNITGTAAVAAVGKHHATYKHLPGGRYRLRWHVTGTFAGGEGFTVAAGLDTK
jgi:hypothetical protein